MEVGKNKIANYYLSINERQQRFSIITVPKAAKTCPNETIIKNGLLDWPYDWQLKKRGEKTIFCSRKSCMMYVDK